MKKRILALVLSLVMALTLFGCGGNDAQQNNDQPADSSKPYAGTTIRVLTANQTCVEKVIYPALDEFYEKTGIKVEMEILGNDDYANKAAIELAGKSDNLDVIFLRPLTDLKQYCQNGWLTDISRIGDDADFDLSDYFEASLDSCTYDGVLYGVPIVAESQIMYYRKDLLEAKGLSVPTTLDELEQVAAALNDPANDMYGFFMRGKSNALITQFSSILYSFGGRFNTATESLAITDDQIGFSVIPAGESGTPTPFYATIGAWSIPVYSQKQEAALEFIKWAESKEMGLRMTEEVQNAGCRSSIWANDEAMASFPADMLQAMIDSRSVAVAGDRPTVINVGEARDILSVPIQAAILGNDFQPLLEEAHNEFQALIDSEN